MTQIVTQTKTRLSRTVEAPVIASGVWPVMVTPFTSELKVDEKAIAPLVEFYLRANVEGLFTACWSSEVEYLSFAESLDLVRHTVAQVQGRVPVYATPHAGGEGRGDIRDRVLSLLGVGTAVPILIVNRFGTPDEPEPVILDRLEALFESIPNQKFGVYESPTPYHRLLSVDGISRLAKTGRVVFHKDTCQKIDQIRKKIEAARGTPLRFFNAHSPTLLESVRAGGSGYCGIGANFYPELYVRLCHNAAEPKVADAIHTFLLQSDTWTGNDGYPVNAKAFIKMCGVPMETHCRMDRKMTAAQGALLDRLARELTEIHKRLDVMED